MARVKSKGLFGFLKDRHIFRPQGAKDLHEYMTAQEKADEFRIIARRGFKKATKK